MNLESLLEPLREDAPCGDDLEYDAAFMALEQARGGKAEQQFGNTIIPAEPPDWQQVAQQAQQLLSRTRDIRLLVILSEAWTHTQGLTGCAAGLTLLSESLTRYWSTLHPALEFDGEPDLLMRVSALAALGPQSGLMRALRQSWLLKSALGEINLRDALALLDGSKSEVADFPGGVARLREVLQQPDLPAAQALRSLAEQLTALRLCLTQHLDSADMPDLAASEKPLLMLVALLPQQRESAPASVADELPAVETRVSPASPAVPDWQRVSLQSRADAELMLEKVRLYFQQHEPSHPAPIMLERVQRLIQLDFLDIIRDLAPDAVTQLQGLFGRAGE
ncbi:type VI secretion system protein TssA [Pantoea sp.]|uniref:type VI secretion system protein TssA n=1 Tax=Pantoea sp. TaxID=69393 RepID=UPI0031E05ACC